ncbi:uncharacterized protein LOC134827532 [Culicoides brevitarsis]|uniref:uncharacterized protein LOC134827532 n=1 Tax=Culicoides brevitarsis TaxID=469753 RepID=UPI00307BD504
MATVIKYVGRTSNQVGKTVWEIVGNLKNFGVGRYFKRNSFERYPEPCYMRILKVEALPEEPNRKVRVYVERVFRGHRIDRPVEMESTTYKPDFILMPRDWTPPPLPEVKIREVPSTMDLPPMLKELMCIEKETDTIPKIPLKLKQGMYNFYKPKAEA